MRPRNRPRNETALVYRVGVNARDPPSGVNLQPKTVFPGLHLNPTENLPGRAPNFISLPPSSRYVSSLRRVTKFLAPKDFRETADRRIDSPFLPLPSTPDVLLAWKEYPRSRIRSILRPSNNSHYYCPNRLISESAVRILRILRSRLIANSPLQTPRRQICVGNNFATERPRD